RGDLAVSKGRDENLSGHRAFRPSVKGDPTLVGREPGAIGDVLRVAESNQIGVPVRCRVRQYDGVRGADGFQKDPLPVRRNVRRRAAALFAKLLGGSSAGANQVDRVLIRLTVGYLGAIAADLRLHLWNPAGDDARLLAGLEVPQPQVPVPRA